MDFLSDKPEKSLEAYQEAESLLKEEPDLVPSPFTEPHLHGTFKCPCLLRSCTRCKLLPGYGKCHPLSPDDDLFIPALDFDLSHKIVMEGKIERKIGELEEKKGFLTKAKSWYKKAANILEQTLPKSGDFPEYIKWRLLIN